MSAIPVCGAVRGAAVAATVVVLLAGMVVPAAAAERAGNCGAPTAPGTVSCVYTDPGVDGYVFRVPAGVGQVHVAALGAAGGSGGTIDARVPAPPGGGGGFVAADFPVSKGDLLRVLVGGHGQDAKGLRPGAGGRNGGGKGGAGTVGGGGGGGSSSVRLGGTGWAARILVAGGGGGGGGAIDKAAAGRAGGGAGGGERGADGSGGDLGDVGKGGIGAVGPSGGAGLKRVTGAVDGRSGYDARFGGYGGEGGYGTVHSFPHQGTFDEGPVGAGGGGGGYAGGSGGSSGAVLGGGGGGGSGFVATSVLAPSVARLGSAEFAIDKDALLLLGNDPLRNGAVLISYRLPTDHHTRPEPGTPPTGSPATTDKRD
jgi:hypothetical protein